MQCDLQFTLWDSFPYEFSTNGLTSYSESERLLHKAIAS
jgi:hypothetical protein